MIKVPLREVNKGSTEVYGGVVRKGAKDDGRARESW